MSEFEYAGPPAHRLNYITNYGYDALDDLISVSQGGRTFTYDSLRRLTAAINPESGAVSYVYDNAGNLTSRTDARGVATNYTYDTLNRLQTQTYTDSTPTVNYTYDNPNDYGMGLLTQVSNGNSTITITAYDPLGRVTSSQQATGGQTYAFAYGYNLAGALTSETFPSGRVVATGYNVINQPITVSGTNNGAVINYVTSASYAPHGAPSQVWLGNTLVDNYAYNSRLQPTSLSTSVNNNGGNTFLSYVLNWGTTDNNGNLQSVDEYNGGLPVYPMWLHFTQSYSYHAVNRLTWALETSQTSCSPAANYACWFRTFQYDNRGNMWVPTTGMGGIAPAATMPSSNVYTANNQIQATPYDAAGNQMVIGATAFTYDAENRQTSATNPPAYGGGTAYYRYDGKGQRVQKLMDSGITTYVYDIQGRLTAEYTNFPNPTPACRTCYFTRDHLGSTRMVTDQAANLISRHDYLPFGEEITAGNASRDSYFGRQDFVKGLFTGKERDAESGLDYFGARYLSAAIGRFTTVDPEGASASLFDPQRWNGYSYAVNNPLKFVDRDGEVPLLVVSGLVGAGVGAAGGAIFDVANQLIQNGGDFSAINGREVGAAALGGAVSGGIAGLTLGLIPA